MLGLLARKEEDMEETVILYRGNYRRLRRDWGHHCKWPPSWVVISQELAEFIDSVPGERDEIYEGGFRTKVIKALHELYGIDVGGLSQEEIMRISREKRFWIGDDGCVSFLPPSLWDVT